MSDNILEIDNLSVVYPGHNRDIRAVNDITLRVRRGEILGLVGESGCGKTTLGLSLLRLNDPGRVVGGSIKVDGIDILSLRGEQLRKYRWEKTAMVFQYAMNALDPVMKIEHQIVETIVQHKKIGKEAARRKVAELLQIVNIDPSRSSSYPHELSGGMRQRVAIVMAICLNPSLLIADEPTTALDVVVQAGILGMIKKLQHELGLTVILISHDISIMSEMANSLAIMYAGRIVETGPSKKIIEDPRHPYTQALLESVPEIGSTRKIREISATPPNLSLPALGCTFHPRCPYAFDECRMHEPPLSYPQKNEDTKVACWLELK